MIRLAIYQMDVVTADPRANYEKVAATLARTPCDVLVLPELWSTGYCNKEFAELAPECDAIEAKLAALSSQYHCTIIGTMLQQRGSAIYNHLTVWNKGTLELVYDKIHLFTLLREEKYLTPGGAIALSDTGVLGAYGVGICYDLRFPEMFRALSTNGAGALFLPSQWPLARVDHFRALCIARAIENQAYFISCNNVGSLHENMQFAGNSMVIDPWGNVLAEGSRNHEEVLCVEIDPTKSSEVRRIIPVFRDRRPECY
ncbi:carbon-nitrogen family hydrolase [Chrysiogenes arsenatis]|uniref:carbon-nitrogen family hydrolase n=1 Tax=Chrysiogenes arsenatis TaxID=309797 RepID=UPI00041C4540|nr:carbon-nitrogen family hydrolase [Chrysiogenes arsenatis]